MTPADPPRAREISDVPILFFGESVFRAYITIDLESFEKEYRQYLRQLVKF